MRLVEQQGNNVPLDVVVHGLMQHYEVSDDLRKVHLAKWVPPSIEISIHMAEREG